jgi:hypothetical protein
MKMPDEERKEAKEANRYSTLIDLSLIYGKMAEPAGWNYTAPDNTKWTAASKIEDLEWQIRQSGSIQGSAISSTTDNRMVPSTLADSSIATGDTNSTTAARGKIKVPPADSGKSKTAADTSSKAKSASKTIIVDVWNSYQAIIKALQNDKSIFIQQISDNEKLSLNPHSPADIEKLAQQLSDRELSTFYTTADDLYRLNRAYGDFFILSVSALLKLPSGDADNPENQKRLTGNVSTKVGALLSTIGGVWGPQLEQDLTAILSGRMEVGFGGVNKTFTDNEELMSLVHLSIALSTVLGKNRDLNWLMSVIVGGSELVGTSLQQSANAVATGAQGTMGAGTSDLQNLMYAELLSPGSSTTPVLKLASLVVLVPIASALATSITENTISGLSDLFTLYSRSQRKADYPIGTALVDAMDMGALRDAFALLAVSSVIETIATRSQLGVMKDAKTITRALKGDVKVLDKYFKAAALQDPETRQKLAFTVAIVVEETLVNASQSRKISDSTFEKLMGMDLQDLENIYINLRDTHGSPARDGTKSLDQIIQDYIEYGQSTMRLPSHIEKKTRAA